MDDEQSHSNSIPHNGQILRSFMLDFKFKVATFAENNNINAAAEKFSVDRIRIRECKSEVK